jgi:hypothetical protein
VEDWFLTGPRLPDPLPFANRLVELVGSAGNAPVRHFQLCLTTPDLQSGNWIASLKMVAGVGALLVCHDPGKWQAASVLPGVS